MATTRSARYHFAPAGMNPIPRKRTARPRSRPSTPDGGSRRAARASRGFPRGGPDLEDSQAGEPPARQRPVDLVAPRQAEERRSHRAEHRDAPLRGVGVLGVDEGDLAAAAVL